MEQTQKIAELTRKLNSFGGWSGILYVVFCCIGWFMVAGYWPLHKPTDGAEAIAEFYSDGLVGVRLGLIIVMWSAVFELMFTTAVANHLSRIEGRSGPLTHMMLLGGYATAMLTFYPPLWWLTAAFRPDSRAIELTYLLNDIGWLQLVGGVSLVVTMYLAVGIAALVDNAKQPTFPRWSGFASLWVFVLVIPGQLLFMFKTGPFAWNGLISFWVAGGVFFGWFLLIGYLLIQASNRERLSH